jgi:multicomponent Na+:H+ antiporter subunit G
MQIVLEILASAALLAGTFFVVVSAIGMVRFPDVFCRLHATGKAGTMGIIMMILGTAIAFVSTDFSVFWRGVLAVFFQLLTTPAATHLIARAAYIRQYPLSDRTAVDELKAFLPSLPDEVGGAE